MYEDDDIEVAAVARELDSAQTEWVKNNLTPGNQDFSLVITVGRNNAPSVWCSRAQGTSQNDGKEVTVTSRPNVGARTTQILRGSGSECVVYVIGGRRIVVCW